MLLTTPTDVWALRYPDTNELWILERSIAALGGPEGGFDFDQRAASGITRVFSGQLVNPARHHHRFPADGHQSAVAAARTR